MNTDVRDNSNWIARAGINGWAAFTPTWAATGTAVAAGNATVFGRYAEVGRTVVGNIVFVAGSTSTFGTGDYSWALPVAVNVAATTSQPVGRGYIHDSGTARYLVAGEHIATDSVRLFLDALNTVAGQLVPFTWAQNDALRLGLLYEAAA